MTEHTRSLFGDIHWDIIAMYDAIACMCIDRGDRVAVVAIVAIVGAVD